MFLTLEKLQKQLKENTEGKIQYAIKGYWYKNAVIITLIILMIIEAIFSIFPKIPKTFFFISYDIVILVSLIYILTRKCAFGYANDRYTFIQYSHFGYNINKVYEIPINKIRYLNLKKIFNLRIINISFIANTGKLTRIKFYYSTIRIGSNFKKYKNNANNIYNLLREKEKELDKGDF